MFVLFGYMVRRVYLIVRKRYIKRRTPPSRLGTPKTGAASISILLPDGTSYNQSLLPDSAHSETSMGIASPSSGSMVLIPSDAIHPYDVVKVGQSDTVEFDAWQHGMDVTAFTKKIQDISSRLTKLPFAHSSKNGLRFSLDASSVLFLGRNVDEPKLVFRNPLAETEQQRPNIPIFTQSIRNAVASSALRECPGMTAYVPRALCGTWNTFQGIFQEYVTSAKNSDKNTSSSVSISTFIESPQLAIDTAVLVLLLRDTDAHDGNYVRDLRRKIALYDLGCALADEPIPADPIDRMCLDNFELWKRVPELLDEPFGEKHAALIESIDFAALKTAWTKFSYHPSIVERGTRLVPPQRMLRVLEMHANFILACIAGNRTVLFAAEVMFGGMYDDVWLELGGSWNSIDQLETRLVEIAKDSELFSNLSFEKGKLRKDREDDMTETAVEEKFT
jgi:hypothetical protein